LKNVAGEIGLNVLLIVVELNGGIRYVLVLKTLLIVNYYHSLDNILIAINRFHVYQKLETLPAPGRIGEIGLIVLPNVTA
jgi:hypothetical protein